jgi:predicted DNA-binding transcriptional regulator AlpA
MSEDTVRDEFDKLNSKMDLVLSVIANKRLRRIEVARKLGITEETLDRWKDDPKKNFPLRGADGKWSETEIENWINHNPKKVK